MHLSLRQFIYNPVCFKCGSLFVEAHLFCESCFELYIAPRAELKKRVIFEKEKVFDHYYLFDWNPGESDLISRLVYQMKGNRCVRALRYYANILVQQLFENEKYLMDYKLIVSLPGSSKSSVHARILSIKFSAVLRIPEKEILVKPVNLDSQKTRSLQERKDLKLKLHPFVALEEITKIRADKTNIIYVDDILTTGSTFKAAREAIGVGERACLLTLFYRPSV